MTQKELAEKLNVTDRTISRWECAVNLPDVEMLKTIAVVLEVDINYFYEDINTKQINYKEQYDYDTIKKFKINSIAPLIIISLAIVVLLIVKVIVFNITSSLGVFSNAHSMLNYYLDTNMHNQVVAAIILLIVSIIAIVISLVFYLRNTITFKCFYKQKMYQTAYICIYKKIQLFYSVIFIISIIILLL